MQALLDQLVNEAEEEKYVFFFDHMILRNALSITFVYWKH